MESLNVYQSNVEVIGSVVETLMICLTVYSIAKLVVLPISITIEEVEEDDE